MFFSPNFTQLAAPTECTPLLLTANRLNLDILWMWLFEGFLLSKQLATGSVPNIRNQFLSHVEESCVPWIRTKGSRLLDSFFLPLKDKSNERNDTKRHAIDTMDYEYLHIFKHQRERIHFQLQLRFVPQGAKYCPDLKVYAVAAAACMFLGMIASLNRNGRSAGQQDSQHSPEYRPSTLPRPAQQ